MSNEDYYQTLGIKKPSDPTEIKKAYHRLALKYHPDKNKSPDAGEHFKKINEAYDVLSTPEKKEIYDRHGKDGLNQHNMRFDESNIPNIFKSFFGGNGVPFGVPFGHMGGGMGGGRGAFQFSPFDPFGCAGNNSVSEPIEVMTELSLVDLFKEKTLMSTIERRSPCDLCHGTGSEDKVKRNCQNCQGRKMVQHQMSMGPMISIGYGPCPTCEGTGIDRQTKKCQACLGKVTVKEMTPIRYTIQLGHKENDVLVIKNAGHINTDMSSRGDVVVRLKIISHSVFHRVEDFIDRSQVPRTMTQFDLLVSVNLTLVESLCGFTRVILHVSGHEVPFSSEKITKEGEIRIIDNEGLPLPTGGQGQGTKSTNGRLLVRFHIEAPSELTVEQKKVIRQLIAG